MYINTTRNYVVIIFFEGIVPSKIILPFPWNPYLKTDLTSLLILLLVKDFDSPKKILLKDDNKWAYIL